MPPACRAAVKVISPAALRASRLISWTVKMTPWPGAACSMSRASLPPRLADAQQRYDDVIGDFPV
jgi:hypothetical protein